MAQTRVWVIGQGRGQTYPETVAGTLNLSPLDYATTKSVDTSTDSVIQVLTRSYK